MKNNLLKVLKLYNLIMGSIALVCLVCLIIFGIGWAGYKLFQLGMVYGALYVFSFILIGIALIFASKE